jgi:hypothetical protein
MAAYFKAGTFQTGKFGLSWHKDEQSVEPIVVGDDVFSAQGKAGILGIEPVKAPLFLHVPGRDPIKSGKDALVLVNVPWTNDGIQDLERQVSWYEPISNRQYAEILNPLCETWQVIGALHCGPLGEVFAVQFEMDSVDIGGLEAERHEFFLLVAEDRKTGKKYYGTTATRVVCQNTFNAAVSNMKTLPSGKDAAAMLMFRTALQEAAIKTRRAHIASLNRMFTQKIESRDEIDAVANILFPMPKRPGFLDLVEEAEAVGYDMTADNTTAQFAATKAKTTQRDYQAAMDRQETYIQAYNVELSRFNDEFPYAADTKYALWQAATAVQKPTSTIYGRTEEDVATYKLLFGGDRAKTLTATFAELNKK